MERILANWYICIYEALFTQAGTYSSLTTYSDAISGLISSGGVLYGVYESVRAVALGILTVYFVISLGTRLEGRETSPSVVFRTFLQFFTGYVLAFFSFDIVLQVFLAGDWMASAILQDVSGVDDFSAYTEVFIHSLEELGFTEKFLYLMKGLLPYLVCVGCDLYISYACCTRVIRVCVNAALSPVAAANFFEGTRHSDAARFLKRTIAMGLQCSVIMIITAATVLLSTYMTESGSMAAGSSVTEVCQEMLDSASVDYGTLQIYVWAATDKKGYVVYNNQDQEYGLKTEYQEAISALTVNVSTVTESDEEKYKSYERLLNIEVLERTEQGHYVYNEDGYAELNPEYRIFTLDKTRDFLDALLGGNNYWAFMLLLVIRTGLIKQSMAYANTIMGL